MVNRRDLSRKAGFLSCFGIVLALSACATANLAKPDFSKLNFADFQQEQAKYALCVAVNSVALKGGSPDVTSVVDTALDGCSTAGISKILATADCTDQCALFVVQTFRMEVRQWATAGLLRRQASGTL